MGSIEEKTELESDEEITFSTSQATTRVHSFDFEIPHTGPHAALSTSWLLKKRTTPLRSVYIVLIKPKLNMLLPFGPLAILLHHLIGKHGWVLFFSLLGITPLAERLSFATKQLEFYTGATGGGDLLNATFGNAIEMIISISGLKHEMMRVVKLSLLGSILSNMLLVLGCAFFAAGITNPTKVHEFSKAAASMNSGSLLMAVMGLTFPAVLHFTHTEVNFGKSELALSRFSSCIMLVAYASYVFFQLQNQPNLYSLIDEERENFEEDAPELTQWEVIFWLAILTLLVSIQSGYLVDAIEGASESLNMPVAFICVILLPIAEHATDHASTIMSATENKLDIAIIGTIGSSVRISMFVIPFCVVFGWFNGKPMDLNFELFETITLFITVLVVAFMLQEGASNCFKGLMLILCYLMVAATFLVHV